MATLQRTHAHTHTHSESHAACKQARPCCSPSKRCVSKDSRIESSQSPISIIIRRTLSYVLKIYWYSPKSAIKYFSTREAENQNEKAKWKGDAQGKRGKADWFCGSQGENSINCLARHKIMLHYRLARLRKKPPNVAQGSALRCRDKDGMKRGVCERERLMDRRHRYVRHTPKSAFKPCASDLASVFLRFFLNVFLAFLFGVFLYFVVVVVIVAGNSNCRWPDETMTIEMAMKLPMRRQWAWHGGWQGRAGQGRREVISFPVEGGASISIYVLWDVKWLSQRKATIDTSQTERSGLASRQSAKERD